MKMNGWMLSLILAAVITALAVLTESNDPNKDKVSYAIKIYVISFLTIYFGWMFLSQDGDVKHEFNTGEPPF